MRFALSGVAAIVALVSFSATASACSAYADAQAAFKKKPRDVAAAAAAHDRMRGDPTCEPVERLVGRSVAVLLAAEAMDLPSARRGAALTKSLHRARAWQPLLRLGELAYAEKDFPAAKALLTEAMVDASALTPQEHQLGLAPTPDALAYLVEIHQKALLLSESMDDTSKRGECFIRTRTRSAFKSGPPPAVPVRFRTNEATLTEEGRRDTRKLYACLSEVTLESVVLVGHADERGGRDLNCRLSRDRAETVRAELRALGLPETVTLSVEGRCADEPFFASDRDALTTDEQYALDRRVELQLKERRP